MSAELKTGLLGEVLAHSISPRLHGYLGDDSYRLFETKREDLDSFLHSDEWEAINVTMPYKQAVIPYCDTLSRRASLCGAVNVLVKRDGKIRGDNTDHAGFCHLAEGIEFAGRTVCILGSGGAAATARVAAADLGAAKTVTVSRSGPVRYEDSEAYSDAHILINATPVGMHPNTEACPVDLAPFSRLEAVIDIVANPIRTTLLQQAEARGIPARGGLVMLCTQAHEARRVFTGEAPSLSRDGLYRRALFDTQNIALIGMPGSGKTTFAAHLAEALHRPVLDTDALIEARAKMSIPDIFEKEGEAAFRDLESDVLREVSKRQGILISCGGGLPLRAENRLLLKHNSFVVRLCPPLSELSREGRPLSTSPERLAEMAREREAAYREAADAEFVFTKSDPQAFDKLLSLIKTR